MTPTPPNPWGSCFDATFHNFLSLSEESTLIVCHGVGIATRPGQEGMRIAHAWLELFHPKHGKIAVDCIWLIAQPAELYRRNLKVEHVVEYGRDEYMELCRQHDFPGPWDPTVAQFTKEGLSAASK